MPSKSRSKGKGKKAKARMVAQVTLKNADVQGASNEEVKSQGLKVYSPMTYAASDDYVSILVILDHPIDVGFTMVDDQPLTLGPDRIFAEPSLNALIKVMINLMCEAGYNRDVARCLIMSSVLFGYAIPFGGPPTWIDVDIARYQELADATRVVNTKIMKHLIGRFKNLSGCLILGEQAFLETKWLREEEQFKHLIVNTKMLPPPRDIALETYNPSHRDILFQTFFAILARQGVPTPELSLDRVEYCLPISEIDRTVAVPDGATCYICLDEGLDDENKPLVRDCSCRGDSAGFAHLSCIVEYAKQKSKEEKYSKKMSAFMQEPWSRCPNCKQLFKNQLSLDLSSAFVSFADAEYGYGHAGNSFKNNINVMEALRFRIETILNFNRENMANYSFAGNDISKEQASLRMNTFLSKNRPLNAECKTLCMKLLSLVDQTKKDWKMDNWVHMPRSSIEYQQYKFLCGEFEATGYNYFAMIMLNDFNHKSDMTSLEYTRKALIINKFLGINKEVKLLESNIAALKIKMSGLCSNNEESTTDNITLAQNARTSYEQNLKEYGLIEHTMFYGLTYASCLLKLHCGIKAERLIMKLAADSHRVHGQDHDCTRRATRVLERCKKRLVLVMPESKAFRVLQYTNDGETCVVTDLLKEPLSEHGEGIVHVESNLIQPQLGCPVICRGLVSSSHLNGKLGDVRGVRKNTNGVQLLVHFECSSLKSMLVKPENLRIAFELPPIEASDDDAPPHERTVDRVANVVVACGENDGDSTDG